MPAQQGALAQPRSSRGPGHNVDLLASMVRSKTQAATPEDISFYNHVSTCSKPVGQCQPNCEQGKKKLSHYKGCDDRKCLHCVLARLIMARDRGKADRSVHEELVRTRTRLTESVNSIKKTANDLNESKVRKKQLSLANPHDDDDQFRAEDMTFRTHETTLQHQKREYAQNKEVYEEICAKIYDMWKEIPERGLGVSQVAGQTGTPRSTGIPQTADKPGQASVLQAHAGRRGTGKSSTPVGSPAALNSTQLAPGVAPRSTTTSTTLPPATSSPVNNSMVDGMHVDFKFGNNVSVLTSYLDQDAHALTGSIVQDQDDVWFSHGLSDDSEPDWSTQNILTRAEINEADQAQPNKRLFLSGREHEFLSRAGQEFVIEALSEAIRVAKHRANTTNAKDGNGSEIVRVSSADVRYALQMNNSLVEHLVRREDIDAGNPRFAGQ